MTATQHEPVAAGGDRRRSPDRRRNVAEAELLRRAALTALRLGDVVTAARLVRDSDRLDPPQAIGEAS